MAKLEFMSPFSHATRFDHAVAIVAGKLLKLPL
jgi:hypothetical protein